MLEVADKDLFGNEAGTESPGEFFIISHLLQAETEIVSRSEWCFDNLPDHNGIMLDMEDAELLNDALQAYIFGLYSLVILSSDGFCERMLTDAIESKGDRRSARSGFGAILRSAEKLEVLHPFILSRISRLHALRNNLCHEKGPESPFRIFRRSASERTHHELLMKTDAREALCLMRGVADQVKRCFPRTWIPGVGPLANK